jgi:hypothetical protein
METQPRIMIIILNWKGLGDTIECVESLQRIEYANCEIIIVDNGSSNDEAEVLDREFGKRVSIVRNDRNYGFAEGNNIGIRIAIARRPDYIMLLNNDTIVDKHFLNELVFVAQSDPKIGIVGPKIFFYPPKGGGSDTIYFAGGKVIRSLGQVLHVGLHKVDVPEFGDIKEVDFITGCCMLVKVEVIEKIGMLNPNYFAYFEDLDWNIRARKAGFKIVFVPEAKIWHKASATTGYLSPTHMYLMTRNRILFARMNLDRTSFAFLFLPYLLCVRIPRDVLRAARKGGTRSIFAGFEDGFSGKLRFVGGPERCRR